MNNNLIQNKIYNLPIIATDNKNSRRSDNNYLVKQTTLQKNQELNPSFTGSGIKSKVGRIVDVIQRKIETGGFFLEFLAVDIFGMMIPRTWQAYNRNKEELGGPNYKAGNEEVIREILSGPSFFIIPMAFLSASRKLFGTASHIKTKMLDNFKEIAQDKINKPDKTHISDFYQGVVDKLYNTEALNKTIGKDKATNKKLNIIKGFVELHDEYTKHRKAEESLGVFAKLKNIFFYKDTKKIKDQKAELAKEISRINRNIGDSKELGTSMADSTQIKFGEICTTAENFVDDCINYSSDVLNSVAAQKDGKESLLEKMHEYKKGARKLVTTTAIATIAAVLYYIPILYKQNKQFPGINGLVDENGKNKTKEAGHAN